MLVLEEKQTKPLIYKVQGKEGSYWVQRQSDRNLFCHVRVTSEGIEGDCPDAIYRNRPCKHCFWVIDKEVEGTGRLRIA